MQACPSAANVDSPPFPPRSSTLRLPGRINVDRHAAARAPSDVDAGIAALAATQDGLVTRADLLALPLTGSAIGGRVAAGRLHIVFRGVYAVGHPPSDRRARLRAALLAVGPRAALSHRTAASHRRHRATASTT